jgi:periplasmic protein TonB
MSQAATVLLNEPLSAPRIGGIAAALAIHVAALMLLMAPMTYVPPAVDAEPIMTLFEDVKPPEITIPPPLPIAVTAKPLVVPLVRTPTVAPEIKTPPLILAQGGENDIPYFEPKTEHFGEVIAPPSGPISLSTEFAPAPKYPALSLRNGEEGIVLLLVKVGADGLPIEATIKKSSGYRELDKNALKQVLATWRFHPAMFQGIAIPALALVPVNYTIN